MTITDEYAFAATRQNQEIAVVVKLLFDTPIYLTTHAVAGITGTQFPGTLIPKASISQSLNPDDSRAEIGTISFQVLDNGLTAEIKSRLDVNEGLKGTVVEVYRGGRNDDFSVFSKIQTQIIDNQVSISPGLYKFACSDIQRSLKKDIFEKVETSITATLTNAATTLNVVQTENFEPCYHAASFSYAPGQTLYMLKVIDGDNFEIMSATGKTSTSFTGLTRGLFFTDPLEFAFEDGEDQENQVKVEQFVYLELPAPAMAYALMTGQIIGGGTIPSNWNLGIDPTWLDLDSFQYIGEDWFDPSDYSKGLIYRFEGVEKTEGKRFIEQEVLKMIAYMPIDGDGKFRFKRIARIIGSTDYRYTLDPSNIVKHGDLQQDLSKVANVISIKWGYVDVPNSTKGFTRRDRLIDLPSVEENKGAYYKNVEFRGLSNARHTRTTLTNIFNAYRDRYSFAPYMIDLDLLPTVFDLQVGETVKVKLPNIKDPATGLGLDRTFEVQRVSMDLITGSVKVKLFASSKEASILPDDGSGGSAELPDGWYSSEGTNASTILSIDGSGSLSANGTLTGNPNTRTIYYILGDFTIPNGRTLTIEDNVFLRVRGYFQNNGTIRASGTDNSGSFIGTTVGGSAIRTGGPRPGNIVGYTYTGLNDSLPALTVDNDGGVLTGIPQDMRGTAGPQGRSNEIWINGDQVYDEVFAATPGNGGNGGGSLVVVCRGAGLGVGAEIDVSGDDGALGGISGNYQGGSGGGGAPGSIVFLIDGNLNNYPVLNGRVKAEFGFSPTPTAPLSGSPGKATSTIDLGVNNARVLFVPKSRTTYPDYGVNEPVTAGASYNGTLTFRQATAPTDADAQTAASRNLLANDTWFDSSGAVTVQKFYNGSAWVNEQVQTSWGNVTGTGKPADNATVGATWGTNIGNRPVELTDGRIASTISGAAILVPNAQIDQGDGVGRNATRGLSTGFARDGDTITFSQAWDQIPVVRFNAGGLSQSSSLTSNQFQDIKAANVSTTGFDVSAKLKELAGTTTPVTDTGSTSSTLDGEMHKSAAAQAFDDTYTFQYDVTVSNYFDGEAGGWIAGYAEIGIYTNDGSGWVKRATVNHFGNNSGPGVTYSNQTIAIVVDGLTNHGGREFGINIESAGLNGATVNFDSVSYTTATAPAESSATPSGAPDIQFFVLGGE